MRLVSKALLYVVLYRPGAVRQLPHTYVCVQSGRTSTLGGHTGRASQTAELPHSNNRSACSIYIMNTIKYHINTKNALLYNVHTATVANYPVTLKLYCYTMYTLKLCLTTL